VEGNVTLRYDKEKVNDLYSSPDIIKVIKLREVRLKVLAARVGKTRSAYEILSETLSARNHPETITLDDRMV
jgi:hypothetical protein